MGVLPGEIVSVEGIESLKVLLADALAEPAIELALSFGTPGAYRKTTVLVMSDDGRILAFAKLAHQQPSQLALANEATTLARLNAQEQLIGRVPTLILSTIWKNARIDVTSAGPNCPGPREPQACHGEFLRLLDDAFGVALRFRSSRMWHRMTTLFSSIEPRLERALAMQIREGLLILDQRIGEVTLSMTLAHRDFTPWNSRQREDGSLFVFDWESAQEEYTSTFDACHFAAMNAAVRNKMRVRPRSILQTVEQMTSGRQVYDLPSEYLAYLLDTTLFYAEAEIRAPQGGTHKVFRWMANQVAQAIQP
jgi:hypothetical protein